MNETLTPDANSRGVAGAVTDDSNLFIKRLRIDDTTKGLKVLVVGGTGSGTLTTVTDGITTVTSASTLTFTSGAVVTNGGSGNAEVAIASSIIVGTSTITSGTTTRVLYDNGGVVGEYVISGTGNVAMTTSPTFITPTLGVASATTINKVTLTAPATGSTLTIADGKTLTASNSITLAGTDSTTMTFPTTTATLARTDAGQTFTGVSNITSWNMTTPVLGTPTSGTLTNCSGLPAASVVAGSFGTGAYVMDTKLTVPNVLNTSNAITCTSNAATIPVTSRTSTVTNNSAATFALTITTTSAIDGQLLIVRILDFSGVAQTIGWTNTENSTVSAPLTSNGSTTLPLTVGFQYNGGTSKWRCIAVA